jgi:hypothetical protein
LAPRTASSDQRKVHVVEFQIDDIYHAPRSSGLGLRWKHSPIGAPITPYQMKLPQYRRSMMAMELEERWTEISAAGALTLPDLLVS